MFARIKKAGQYERLQIVENRRENKKSVQRIIATVGRMDQLKTKGNIESLVRSLSRFSEKVLLVLSSKNQVDASAKNTGPAFIFERLWKELKIDTIFHRLLKERRFSFDVEKALSPSSRYNRTAYIR